MLKESMWMKPFIDLNTHKRLYVVNRFQKDLFKLMNNTAYDLWRTLEIGFGEHSQSLDNIGKCIDTQLVFNVHWLRKLISMPRLKHMIHITND